MLFLYGCISYRTITFIFFFLVGFYFGLPWYCTFNFVNKKYFQNIIKLFYYFLFSLIKYFVDDKFVSQTNQSTLFSKVSINFNINFISNNIKGLQLNKKRARVFEYFKRKIGPSGILFLQETHSSKETEVKWSDEFQGQMFFSYGKTNSCGVLTAFYGLQNLSVNKTVSDNSSRILILDTKIDDYMFLFINFYNANTEKEQIQTITTTHFTKRI